MTPFFLSDEVLGGGKNMHMWKAVVEIHELVVSFKTVKEESYSSLQVLFVYEILQHSHFNIASPLLGWLIFLFRLCLLYSVFTFLSLRGKRAAYVQYVHMLNGLNKIKGSVQFTKMAMYCLCFYLWTPVPRYQSDFCLHSRTADVKLHECVRAAGEINATQW